MNQRLMDLAWTHFNHLIDGYEAEEPDYHRTLEAWAELVCVPTGWGTDLMMDWLGSCENWEEEEEAKVYSSAPSPTFTGITSWS